VVRDYKLIKGAATLPVVLLMSSIVMELAIVGVTLSAVLGSSVFSARLSSEALAAAKAGAEDALLRVIRYKNCPGTGCPSSYSITVGTRSTADITITSNGSGVITIASTGISSLRQKKIQEVIGVDSTTGQVQIQSFKEIAI